MVPTRVLVLTCLAGTHLIPVSAQGTSGSQVTFLEKTYQVYPVVFERMPELPSPCLSNEGVEVLIGVSKDHQFTLLPVTVETGEPLTDQQGGPGKGRQLDVDAEDFPTLARTGLHSLSELDQTKTITGRSILEITQDGRPEGSSWTGFMDNAEDILSVLKADNRTVRSMGLSHPELARALFHIWNTRFLHDTSRIQFVLYRGKQVFFKIERGRGSQESIFADEIRGSHHMYVWRELEAEERVFLENSHPELTPEELRTLEEKLTRIHTGEMVPYYVMRYGFYEGHTEYRADPISIAWIFGFKNLQELEQMFGSNLHALLTRPFTGTGSLQEASR